MTMIKDLVTVTVDNAFRLFPIDEERYELFACVEEIVDVFFHTDIVRSPSAIEDERIKSFLDATIDGFRRGSTCLVRVLKDDLSEPLPDIVRDRARRVAVCLNPHDVWAIRVEDRHDAINLAEWCLWSVFKERVVALRAKRRQKSSEDMELQS